jgi:hypothetical protein
MCFYLFSAQEEEGFSVEYLLGRRNPDHIESEDFQARFYRLQIEETLFSSLDSNLDPPINDSSRLRLNIQTDSDRDAQSGRIVFSPGGSEAFVYPRQEADQVKARC